jgi:hypothetical protein
VPKKPKDRRGQPRASRNVPLSLRNAEPGILNRVDNISSSGVLCQTAKKLPLMSKVAMELVLDMPDTFSNETERIACQGVVVRSERNPDLKTGGYGTAIFFTRVSEEDRGKLERFVDHHLAGELLAVL